MPEGPAGLDEHVEGQGEERATDKAVDPSFASLDGLGVSSPCLDAEPPQERCRRRTLDEAVKAKAHEGDTPRVQARPECHHAFEDVVAHRRAHKPQTDAAPMTGARAR